MNAARALSRDVEAPVAEGEAATVVKRVTSSSSTPPAKSKSAYPPIAEIPTQEAPFGICYDFNQGARIRLPVRNDGEWLIRLRDLDTGNVLFENHNPGAFVASSKKFYVRFRIEVFYRDRLVFEHDHDCRDRDVLIQFPVGTLGDTLAWFPYADRFQQAHGCRLTCAMSGLIIPILKDNYPNIRFVTHEEMVAEELTQSFYATYSMGLFFDDKDCLWQPTRIDQKPVHGSGLLYSHIPHGAEDETGDRPLSERVRWLTHAKAFVGLSSGLAWLAWAAGVPCVVISGFTHPTNEFATPYRVDNWHTCNSCWNDPAHRFKHEDFLWCPRHQGTARHFECTRLVQGGHVISAVSHSLSIHPLHDSFQNQ